MSVNLSSVKHSIMKAPQNPIDRALKDTLGAISLHKRGFQLTTENMANAETVAKPGQSPYQRKVVIAPADQESAGIQGGNVKVQTVPSAGKKMHSPNHPYADSQGYITVTDINIAQEMVDALCHKENIDRLTRLHKLGYDIKKQDLELLSEK